MRKIIFLPFVLLLSAFCLFTACSDDDDTNSTLTSDIIGTWSVGSTTVSAQVLGVTVPGTEYTVSEATGDLWKFTSDGEILVNSASAYTYSVSGNSVTVDYGDGTSMTFKGSIANGALLLSSTVADASTLSLLGLSLDSSWFQLIASYSEVALVYSFTYVE